MASALLIMVWNFDNGLEFRQSFWCFHPGERLLVLTVQFSQSTIACVSWGVKENRQRYSSGIAEYPIDLYSGIAEYPIDLVGIELELNSSSSIS
jgi:hypothetical protein